MTLPLTLPVTVVMPGYNAANMIGASLSSLVGQTHQPAEVLVIDDCSSDHTIGEAERFSDLLPVRVIRQETNQGPGVARRRAIEEASQPWISALDADDLALPNHLETLWALAAGDDQTIAIPRLISWSPATSVEVLNTVVLPEDPAERIASIARKNVIPVASLFSRERAIAAGSYSPRRQAEDMELWLRMLLNGATIRSASTPTFVYRRSAVSNSTNILQLTEASLSAVRLAIEHGMLIGAPEATLKALRGAERFRTAELYWHNVNERRKSGGTPGENGGTPGENGPVDHVGQHSASLHRSAGGFLQAARFAPQLSLKESVRALIARAKRS
jgi:glycosyltransferase involved in cell wall biosynthesis